MIENAKIGGALFCSHRTIDIDGRVGLRVGLSPWDKQAEDEYPSKWRWEVVELPHGVQIVNKMSKGSLSVSDSSCNGIGDRRVYTTISPAYTIPCCIFQLVERPKIMFIPRVVGSASDAETDVVAVRRALTGRLEITFNMPRPSRFNLREWTWWALKDMPQWTSLALIRVEMVVDGDVKAVEEAEPSVPGPIKKARVDAEEGAQ